MELEYIVLELNGTFGNIKYGGFKGSAETSDGEFKKKLGNAYFLDTDLQDKIIVVLPEAELRLLEVEKSVTLINNRLTYHARGHQQIYAVLWADDIVEI